MRWSDPAISAACCCGWTGARKPLRNVFPMRDLERAWIVVIDPDAESRSIVRGILISIGARRVTAVGTIERLLEPDSDDIGLMIIRMDRGGMGEDISRAVRRGDTLVDQTIPMMGYAATPTVEIVRRALLSGLDEFLAVPFSGRALSAKLAAILERPKPLIKDAGYHGPDHTKFLKSLTYFMTRPAAA